MKWIKSHKVESIIIGISVMMLIFILIFVKIFFFSDGKDAYGERLDGIEEVRIRTDKLDKIEIEMKKNDAVTKVDGYVTGKIINFMITVQADANAGTVKENANLILENLSKKEQEFYDIEVYIKTSGESTEYPNIGYKSKSSDAFTWIK